MAFWLHRDNVTRSWGPLLCHLSKHHLKNMLHGSYSQVILTISLVPQLGDGSCTAVAQCSSWVALVASKDGSNAGTIKYTLTLSMTMHSPMVNLFNCTQFLETKNISFCMAHRTCHPLSMFGMLWNSAYNGVLQFQYPATSHSHWRGVDQHSTGHN